MLEAISWRNESVPSPSFHAALDKLREQINHIDDELMQLISQRMSIAEKIGAYKKNNNVTIFQQGRWNEVLQKALGKASKVGLSEEFITRYMDAIHMESINRQNKIMNNE